MGTTPKSSPLTIARYDHSDSERERLEQFDVFLEELEHQIEEPSYVPLGGRSTSSAMVLTPPAAVVSFPASAISPDLPSVSGTMDEKAPGIHRDLNDLAFWED